MSQHLSAPISSPTAIKSTITTDSLVFRWFLYLIGQEKPKNDLISEGQRSVYDRLKRIIIYQNSCSIALLATLVYAFLTKQHIVLCATVIVLIVYYKLRKTIHDLVAHLGLKLIAKHFKPDESGQRTLFQIGEYLAKHYQTKSMVMSMTSADNIVRKAVLYSIIFATCIFPLQFLHFWELVFAVYWATCTLINTTIVYKYIR